MINLKIFSVSEYVEYVNESLAERDAVVEGEVSEYRVNQGKWVFFKIKDEEATLECFGIVFRLKFPLEDGMRVRLYGRPKIYAKTGKLSMNVEWAEPAGEGAMKRAFELLKKDLEKEGLFALERKRPITKFPKRIGLITSRESAAYGDFVKVLKHRFGGIEIYLYHAQVQGSEAIPNIVSAFEYFNEKHKELGLDLIVLIRGGGSLEDLAAFNSRDIAYAIFGSLASVVCGVGHEQDVTIADFVADVRASTPSNAAEIIAPQREEVLSYISAMVGDMSGALKNLQRESMRDIDNYVSEMEHFLSIGVQKFLSLAARLNLNLKFFDERIRMQRSEIDGYASEMERFLFLRTQQFSLLTGRFHPNLKFLEERTIMQKSKIDSFIRLLESLSPKAVLQRGYAIVEKKEHVISSAHDLELKDIIGVTLKDGKIEAEINKVFK